MVYHKIWITITNNNTEFSLLKIGLKIQRSGIENSYKSLHPIIYLIIHII